MGWIEALQCAGRTHASRLARGKFSLVHEHLRHPRGDVIERYGFKLTRRAKFDLSLPVLDGPGPDGDAERESDQVRIGDGGVYRNDVPLDDSFVPQEYRSHDDWGPQVIPEGYYFVMGDHRNNSSDSRHWGFVPKKYIIGKVQLRWWPMAHAHVF